MEDISQWVGYIR